MTSMELLTDAELVAACLAGDREAFGRIVERYQRLLCSLAYSATGSLSESEDLAQEAFVDAWRQLRTLREPEKLRPWLCGILRYKAGRLRRSDRQEPVRQAEALAIKQTLDPGAAQIWTTYNILAQIAEKEEFGVPPSGGSGGEPAKAGTPNKAREYRRLAHDAKRNFAGIRHELRRYAPIILATVAACAGQAEARAVVTQYQQAISQGAPDWQALSRVLDRLLAGERDETALCEGLGTTPALLIETILQGLADPATLADLLPSEPPEAT